MKYKVGNRVKIKSFEWYNKNKDENGNVLLKPLGYTYNLVKSMARLCEKVVTIKFVGTNYYRILEDVENYYWTDEMIDCLVEEENLIERFDNNGLPFNEWLSHKGAFYIPDNYVLKDENGNVINTNKIVLEKKKKEYSKTFIEVLDFWYPDRELGDDYQRSHKKDLIEKFQDLLYAKDVYWKLAGEEMGLGKPWEPDWTDHNFKYCIKVMGNTIECVSEMNIRCVLAFPTEEMRNDFLNNFKKEIEECKEFL